MLKKYTFKLQMIFLALLHLIPFTYFKIALAKYSNVIISVLLMKVFYMKYFLCRLVYHFSCSPGDSYPKLFQWLGY